MAQGDIIIGRGVRVEIGSTEGAAKTVSAVTAANPGVATSTAHGLAAKSIGYFSGVSGMVNLEGQAARLTNVLTNTFDLEDIDTSAYPAFSGNCSFIPITAWATLAKATSISEGGGAADPIDVTVLLDTIRQNRNGLLAAQTVTINLLAESLASTAMQLIRRGARNGTKFVFRVTWPNGDVAVFRGEPSLPSRDTQQGQAATGTLAVNVVGFITEGAA
ncbi:MAG: phage tail protein [Burkholderiaceae bacterium]|nr:phage tail protein [Burkholderiaceae bacterium]